MVGIWEECIEELKPLSREIGKGRDVVTRDAYNALPEALKAEVDHPDRPQWEQFVSRNTTESNIVLTRLSEIARLCEIEEKAKLTQKESEKLALTAHDVGFILVPDARITNRAYKWDEIVALFRPDGRATLPADKRYKAVSLMLEMGMAIAAADGEIEREEVESIFGFLKSQFVLEPNDARRVDAYREVLSQQPPDPNGIVKRLKTLLVADQMDTVCHFLVGVAAANGRIESRELRLLQKFYVALGVDLSKLDAILATLSAGVVEPVEVQKGTPGPQGEVIPPHEAPVLALNEDAVRTILKDTDEVARILGDAMSEAEEEEASELTADTTIQAATIQGANPPDGKFGGLDLRYHSVLTSLLARETWSKVDFEELARQNGLMPAGVLDTVNTWSDETHGDFLIEDGETYRINTAISERIQ